MSYTELPNQWGCYDPQCMDSTWDHECPEIPQELLALAEQYFDEVSAKLLGDVPADLLLRMRRRDVRAVRAVVTNPQAVQQLRTWAAGQK